MEIFGRIYESAFGRIGIISDLDSILRIEIVDSIESNLRYSTLKESKATNAAMKQLEEYFMSKRMSFNVSLKLSGSAFNMRVWNELQNIEFGKIASYQDIANRLNTKAVRAVGSANAKNPILFIVPCHRVIRKNGDIGGYVAGSDLKFRLLELERNALLM